MATIFCLLLEREINLSRCTGKQAPICNQCPRITDAKTSPHKILTRYEAANIHDSFELYKIIYRVVFKRNRSEIIGLLPANIKREPLHLKHKLPWGAPWIGHKKYLEKLKNANDKCRNNGRSYRTSPLLLAIRFEHNDYRISAQTLARHIASEIFQYMNLHKLIDEVYKELIEEAQGKRRKIAQAKRWLKSQRSPGQSYIERSLLVRNLVAIIKDSTDPPASDKDSIYIISRAFMAARIEDGTLKAIAERLRRDFQNSKKLPQFTIVTD